MRILVVEDDKETATILKAGLEAECYSVDVEHDGEKGSYRARTNDYDLILLDNVLPGKHGLEVCRELRQYQMTVPVLILSVQSEIEQKVSLLNCGADDYVTKPYSWSELSARVRALLRRPRQLDLEELKIDDLVLDTSKYNAFRGERQIYLTPKEFSLLEYLLKNKGRVVSRAMIQEHVWNGDADPFSNTIETHVHKLRQKIDLPGEKKLIHTLPGRGYKISDSL